MAITLVQSNAGSGFTTPGAISLTFGSAVTAGNLLFAAVATDISGSTTVTVTDSYGNTYAQAGFNVVQGNVVLSIWWCLSGASGTGNIVQATPSASASEKTAMAIAEYSGVASPFPLDGVATGATGSAVAAASTNSVPVSGTGELVVGVIVQTDATNLTFTATSGTAEQNIASTPAALGIVLLDLFNQSSAASVGGTYSAPVAVWAAIGASFAPPGPPPPPAIDQEDGAAPGSVARTVAVAWVARPARDDEAAALTSPPPPPFGLDQEDSFAGGTVAAPLRSWPVPDDEVWVAGSPPPPPTFGLEQEEFWAAPSALVAFRAQPLPDDEAWVTPPPPVFGLDQEDGPAPSAIAGAWLARPSRDDEIGTHFGNFPLEHAEPFVPAAEAVAWLARPATDDEIGSSLIYQPFDQEEGFVPPPPALAWAARPVRDDEVYGPPFAVELEELFRPRTVAVSWLSRPATDDETGAGLKAFALDSDDPFTARVMALPWAARPARDDEASGTFALVRIDEVERLAPRAVSVPWAPRPATDDELIYARGPGFEDDAGAVLRAWGGQWTPVAFRDDETGGSLKHFALEHAEPWVCHTVTIPWNATAFRDEDPGSSLAHFALIEENSAPLGSLATWTAIVYSDDEIGTQLLPIFAYGGRIVRGSGRGAAAVSGTGRGSATYTANADDGTGPT